MTLEDLEQTRLDAYWAEYDRWPGTDPTGKHIKANRAGIRAVVEALHNEVMCRDGDAHIDELFMEILASDGKEAAGGSTREDGQGDGTTGATSAVAATTPAAAPVRDMLGLTEADHRHLQYKHWGIGYCDCKACKEAAR
jgi:hypothetical protein